MSQDDTIRLLQKYGKANDNMRLLKELLVKSSSEIAKLDKNKRESDEKIAGLEFEIRTLRTANTRERENHREELAVVNAQFQDLKGEYAGLSKLAAEREVHIERLNREIQHLRAAVDGRVSKEFLEVREQLTEFDAQKRSSQTLQRLLDEKTADLEAMTKKWQNLMEENAHLPSLKVELRDKTASLASATADIARARETINRLQDDAARTAQDMSRLRQLADEHRGRSDEFRLQLSDDIQRRLAAEQNLVSIERSRADDLANRLRAEERLSANEKARAEELQSNLHKVRLELAEAVRLKEQAERSAKQTAEEVRQKMQDDTESVSTLRQKLHAEQAQLGAVREDVAALTTRLGKMNELRQQLAVAKLEETALRQRIRAAEERAGFVTLKSEATAKKVKDQVVQLTASLREIQRRAGAEGVPRLFHSKLLTSQQDDAHFFSRNGAAESGRVLRAAKKIIDYFQEQMAVQLYEAGEQLQEVVLDAYDTAFDAERHGAIDSDAMGAGMQAFKSALAWVASSELRLLTMAHDKLVSAFVSVAWTREINSKTMEMRLCALWNQRRRGHLLRAPPTVKHITDKDFESGSFKERFWAMMGVELGADFPSVPGDSKFAAFIPGTASSSNGRDGVGPNTRKSSPFASPYSSPSQRRTSGGGSPKHRVYGAGGGRLPKISLLQQQLFKVARSLAASLRPRASGMPASPKVPELVGMDRAHPNRQVLDLEFYALVLTFVRVSIHRKSS